VQQMPGRDAYLDGLLGHTFRSLETTLDWLVDFLRPDAVLVVWTDCQKAQARESV
jgi:hypothetical protein